MKFSVESHKWECPGVLGASGEEHLVTVSFPGAEWVRLTETAPDDREFGSIVAQAVHWWNNYDRSK